MALNFFHGADHTTNFELNGIPNRGDMGIS